MGPRHMDPIYGLLLATHVLSSIFAALHLPTLLRVFMFVPFEPLNRDPWSRLGSIVIFIASGDLLWLAIYGTSGQILGEFRCFSFWKVSDMSI